MRSVVSICAAVFVLSLAGAFYTGYRIGSLEAALAPHPQAAAHRDESDTAHAFFAGEGKPQAISGQIRLAGDLAKRLTAPLTFTKDDALFIIATKPDLGPQPLAVVRISDLAGKSLPLAYAIGPADLMMEDHGEFTGPLVLKVKLSRGGDARTNPGDLLGSQSRTSGVEPGATGVDLELKEIAQGTAAQGTVNH